MTIDAANPLTLVAPAAQPAAGEPEIPGSTPVTIQRGDERPITVTLKAYRTIYAERGYSPLAPVEAPAAPKAKRAKKAGRDETPCAEMIEADGDAGAERMFCIAALDHGGEHYFAPIETVQRNMGPQEFVAWALDGGAERALWALDAEHNAKSPRAYVVKALTTALAAVAETDESQATSESEPGENGSDEPATAPESEPGEPQP